MCKVLSSSPIGAALGFAPRPSVRLSVRLSVRPSRATHFLEIGKP